MNTRLLARHEWASLYVTTFTRGRTYTVSDGVLEDFHFGHIIDAVAYYRQIMPQYVATITRPSGAIETWYYHTYADALEISRSDAGLIAGSYFNIRRIYDGATLVDTCPTLSGKVSIWIIQRDLARGHCVESDGMTIAEAIAIVTSLKPHAAFIFIGDTYVYSWHDSLGLETTKTLRKILADMVA